VIIRREVDYLEDGETKILILKNFVVLFEYPQRDAATSVLKTLSFSIYLL
jgi:hypothetical protein